MKIPVERRYIMLFKDVLRAEMKRKDVSVIKLANALGTTRSYVYQLLNGEIKEPTLSRALKISAVLGISIDRLVDKVDFEK
jgi:hypothetical protein